MKTKRPNILLFISDDHGAWANGCYGNREVQTPTLDRLAAEGARFANAFTPTPVCSPARACLLTGRTASQVGIHDWLQEAEEDIANRDWLAGERTLFDLLHQAGYVTALSGKWHLGQSHLPPRGADYHFGLPGWQGHHNDSYTYVENGRQVTMEGNKSAHITDHALTFLRSIDDERPFFLNVGYIVTHSPYERQYHDPALTALYQDANFEDIPAYVPHPWMRNENGPRDPNSQEQLRSRYTGYYAAATEVDRNVARIIAELEAQGRLDNTLVVYTSDHGCALGHQGFWGKGNSTRPLNMNETSLRIPLLWRGPGVVAGGVVSRCVDHYDTFVTLLSLVGLAPDGDRTYPGADYSSLLSGIDTKWDDTRYGEYGDLRMIRTSRWKFVQRHPNGPHELFDLVSDPAEKRNLIGDASLAAVVDQLRGRLEAFYTTHEVREKSGLRVKLLPRHNASYEAWRDGLREERGLQSY